MHTKHPMPLPREEGEPPITYFLREYVIPGVVFAVMIRWLFMNVVKPMFQGNLVPKRVQRNINDDNELLDAPERLKME